MFYDLLRTFTLEDSDIGALSMHSSFNKFLSLLIRTVFFKLKLWLDQLRSTANMCVSDILFMKLIVAMVDGKTTRG